MKKRSINVLGYTVEMWDFGYAQYMYPAFNGNAEYPVTHKGFRGLHHYLRTIIWMESQKKLSRYVTN